MLLWPWILTIMVIRFVSSPRYRNRLIFTSLWCFNTVLVWSEKLFILFKYREIVKCDFFFFIKNVFSKQCNVYFFPVWGMEPLKQACANCSSKGHCGCRVLSQSIRSSQFDQSAVWRLRLIVQLNVSSQVCWCLRGTWTTTKKSSRWASENFWSTPETLFFPISL